MAPAMQLQILVLYLCAVLCCAVLCCAVLCCAVLCCATLCCAAPYKALPCCGVPTSSMWSQSHTDTCSFVHHPSKGSSAAISLVSWGTSAPSLQLAVLHQPLHPALPAMHLPQLQDWQGSTIFLQQEESAAEGTVADDQEGAHSPAADPVAVSNVVQAWHPTGIHFG